MSILRNLVILSNVCHLPCNPYPATGNTRREYQIEAIYPPLKTLYRPAPAGESDGADRRRFSR